MKRIDEKGFSFPTVLSFIIVAAIVSASAIQIVLTNLFVVGNNVKSQKAFNISEAGLNYYLWHLSHNATDFKDGQSTPTTPDPSLGYGPYTHNYIDDNAVNQGTFTLWIKPQSNGSTIATVRSIGKVKGSSIKRTTEAKIGAASFASYGLVSDTALWFGNTEAASGPVHSNQGIRMDGSNNAEVTSANTTYVPPNGLGDNGTNSHPGVWCSTTVTSPINCNTRDKSSWRYPVPQVDFNQVSTSLCSMKKTAFANYSSTSSLATQSTACSQTPTTRTPAYVPQNTTNNTYSATKGYLVELNSGTPSTYNLYKVSNETDTANSYSTALTKTLVENNIAVPSSGVIFVEDNVWVRTTSTFNGRVSIGAGRLANSSYNANITIADDILYQTKNGTNAIGLIGEDSIYIAPYAPPASGAFTFEVDAATLAQSGSVIYPKLDDDDDCTKGWVNDDQKFVYYGSVASRQTWTWTRLWNNNCGKAVYKASQGAYISGILNNTTQYDYNLLYSPPPSYPITGGYNILSWREILTKP